MKTKEQIIEWLKSKGLYEAFAKNISHTTVVRHVEQCTAERHANIIIGSAFDWEATDEGSKFWNDANTKFLQWLYSDEQAEQSSDRWIFDRGSKEAPFYMVYAEGKTAPTFKHSSMEEATKEADRLAKLLNTKTYILAAVMEIRPEIVMSAVSIDDMVHEEEEAKKRGGIATVKIEWEE